MTTEFLGLCDAAMKAADAAARGGVLPNGTEVSRCIEILKRLKDYPVSNDVLKKTHVDRKLSVILKKHPVERIRLMGVWLFEVWSKTVKNSEPSPRNKTGRDGIVSGDNNITPSVEVKPSLKIRIKIIASRSMEKSSRKDLGPKAVVDQNQDFRSLKKPMHEQSTLTLKCGKDDSLRSKVREIITEALSRVSSEVYSEEFKKRVRGCDPVAVGAEMESVLFKKLGPYNGTKRNRYRSIMFNIKDGNNPDFRRKILLGDVKPEKLVTMSSEEMASDQRRRENEMIKQRKLVKINKSAVEKPGEKTICDESSYLESLW